ncbi:MAG: hypothetical protein EPN88_04500 [Bacteroidetes bacterium]|nr:MAG: hypothetical protein EPN88_04500 [Bacteroidota bacterium]
MKEMKHSIIRSCLIIAVFSMTLKSAGQSTMPEELIKNPLKEQLKYLEERTRIYENYRAIREDMFQRLIANVSDTLLTANNKIAGLNIRTSKLNRTIDSLNNTLESTKSSLEITTRTKNSIRVFGLEVNKFTYNSITWTILAGLLAILGMGFLVFKRNLSVTSDTRKELKVMKEEFETYRKTTREAREKMSMEHFIELKKLKENLQK